MGPLSGVLASSASLRITASCVARVGLVVSSSSLASLGTLASFGGLNILLLELRVVIFLVFLLQPIQLGWVRTSTCFERGIVRKAKRKLKPLPALPYSKSPVLLQALVQAVAHFECRILP